MPRRLTEEEKLLRLITEARFQSTVQKMMDAYRWRWYHPVDNIPRKGFIQNIRAGFPDIVAVRRDRLIFAELKRETGVVSDAQVEWHTDLRRVPGIEVYVWFPRDMKEIEKVLA